MDVKIRKAAVLGAGVMGAQIAAHLAAAGVRVHLLDLPGKEKPKDKKLAAAVGKNIASAPSIIAIEMMKSLKPSPILGEHVFQNLIPGNFEDDMSVLAHVDWVIEAVVERIDIKEKIHKSIAENINPNAFITTNTSGISIAEMTKHFPDHLKPHFFGIHFFNPPRYLHLVEIIPHGGTDLKFAEGLGHWIEEKLGKGIVWANDTTNFIANRIGVYNLQITVKHMQELGLNIETVDALTGKLMGRPSSATFRTLDVVGLDTLAHTSTNVYNNAGDDSEKEIFIPADWIQNLIKKGSLGAKSGSRGCYLKSRDPKTGKSEILAYRIDKDDYEPQSPQMFPWAKDAMREGDIFKRLNMIIENNDPGAQLVWKSLRDTFAYAANRLNEIASGKVMALDEAVKWGFNWQLGPFELWQGLGFQKILKRMHAENVKLPAWLSEDVKFYSPSPDSEEFAMTGPSFQYNAERKSNLPVEKPAYKFSLPKRATKLDDRIVAGNASASLLDIGDGVACLCFHSKMNAIDDGIIEMIQSSVGRVDKDFKALIVANEGEHFSAGANLKMILEHINAANFDPIEKMIRSFQGAVQMLKYAPFPVVTAPHGMTLGGGLEVALHADKQVIASETYAGLVELGVGLVPAGGGTKELALRCYDLAGKGTKVDPQGFLQTAFELIGMAKVSTSGFEAVEMGLFPAAAHVSLSKPYLVSHAKKEALHLVQMGYIQPSPKTSVKVLGDPGLQTFKLALYNMMEGRFISPYDGFIAEKVAEILCGGSVDGGSYISEEQFLALERNAFMELCRQEKTKERIEHMLKTGKPLRN